MIPECFAYHSEADNYREHCDHEFNAQFDRYDGWGDKEAQMEGYYDDFGPIRIPLTVLNLDHRPAEEGDIPF